MAIIVIVILALVLFSFHGKDKMDSGVVSVADVLMMRLLMWSTIKKPCQLLLR